MYVMTGLILIIILLLVERFLVHERDWRGKADTSLLDWADENNYHSARYCSARSELRAERTKS